ncbi:MAG: OprO/OprP family phosphate-selective porin [Muribaculaceae bacterium]|nr:OprO/OprP family phosphate-selective porin [Muribaculaceae bacterium]
MRILTVIVTLAATLPCFAVSADESVAPQTELLNLHIRARADWQGDWNGSEMNDDHSGFKGKYLMLRLDGEILPGLTYSWRQRLNKKITDDNPFNATDWMYVRYSVDGWHFSAGKELVALGGWEYDRNPVDLFCYSVFWQNTPSFEFGATTSYDITTRDNLMFQVTQSIWHQPGLSNIYCYNLMWTGNHGPVSTMWSANLAEYSKGRFISYISLGNKLEMGPLRFELDLMNRATSHQSFLLRDCSVIGDVAYSTPGRRWRIHAKMTYDVNRTHSTADLAVLPGTELKMAGGGVEFFPIVKQRTSLRLHATCYHSWGRNTEESDIMQARTTFLSVGVSWDMNLLRLHRK